MTALTVESIKEFMHLLFKSSEFNNYLVHKAMATTFTTFEISGDSNPPFNKHYTPKWRFKHNYRLVC